MPKQFSLNRPESVLWRPGAYGQERYGPRANYWFENRDRVPAGQVNLQYTIEGEMVYRDSSGETPVRRHEAVLFIFGQSTAYGLPQPATSPYELMWMSFFGAGLVEHVELIQREYGPVIRFGQDRWCLQAMRNIADMASDSRSPDPLAAASVVWELFSGLLGWVSRERQQQQTPVQRAIEQLLRHPTSGRSLKEIAAEHGVSREYLSRAFTQQNGQTPSVYLAQQRLSRALRLLGDTALPLDAVASQAGFTNAHTLARHVRRSTGESPAAWRKCQSRRA